MIKSKLELSAEGGANMHAIQTLIREGDCLEFNKTKDFKMYQENVMIPMGEWAKTRLKNLGKNDVIRFNSQAQCGFGKNISNWVGRTNA